MENKTAAATKQIKESLGQISESTENLKEKVVQRVGETKDKVTGNLSSAADRIHEKSDSAQTFLGERADNLNDYAHQAIEKANQYGHKAADALTNSSDYISNFDYDKTKQQVIGTIKDKPQIGLAVAGLFGLVIGLLIGRRNSR